jgi:putative Mn2+ efflux pump MntP
VSGEYWLELSGIAVGLAMDAFAVAITAGLTIANVTGRHVFRLSFHFGLFQFLMPILGWWAGTQVAAQIRDWDHWVAFALLSCVGGKMLWEALRWPEAPQPQSDPTRGLRLVALSLATSIDALAVGLSMALLDVSVWLPSAVIGLVCATLTAIGFGFGRLLGARCGRGAEVVGGSILILIGIRIVRSHLAA